MAKRKRKIVKRKTVKRKKQPKKKKIRMSYSSGY